MRNVKIDIIDNGFILSYVAYSALGNGPEPKVMYFANKEDLLEHLDEVIK